MDDPNQKRRIVLTAALQTIATACRHLYEEDLAAARAANDVMAIVRTKAALKRDYEAWTAPIVKELETLGTPSVIIDVKSVAAELRDDPEWQRAVEITKGARTR